MNEEQKIKKEIIRIGAHLNELITIFDSAGNLLHKVVRPLMIEFYLRDVIQIIVGATILAIPISFTEEVWNFGTSLPNIKFIYLSAMSVLFICLFVYHNFYKEHIKTHYGEFIKRVISIYILSLLVSGIILFLIDQAPAGINWIITFKRMIIVAFPASMSAAVADMIK